MTNPSTQPRSQHHTKRNLVTDDKEEFCEDFTQPPTPCGHCGVPLPPRLCPVCAQVYSTIANLMSRSLPRSHCAAGTGGLPDGWVSMDSEGRYSALHYVDLRSDGWAHATEPAHEIAQDGPPPMLRDGDYRGEHVNYGHNPDHPMGVPPGKYQELVEYMVRERVKRQKYQDMACRNWAEIQELWNQLAEWWETYDEQRERMEEEYEEWVQSGRVGVTAAVEDGAGAPHVAPLMSPESVVHRSVNLQDPSLNQGIDDGEEEEVDDATPPVRRKRKMPPSDGSTQGGSMGASMEL